MIKTEFDPKPIPDRQWDWSAWRPGNYDLGSFTGYGATKEEAIWDLLEQESIDEALKEFDL